MPAGLIGLPVLGACDNYTPESSGGAERAGHELYSRLGAAGCRLEVVTVPFGRPYDDPGVEVHVARGWDLSSIVGGYAAISPGSFKLVNARYRAARPVVLHANTIHYNSSIALARLARKAKLPLVLTAQVGSMNDMPRLTRAASAAYERTIGRYIVRASAAILAVSQTVRDHMIDLGADPDSVTIVENGVDHARFASPPLADDPDPLVLAVGRLVTNKGPHILVEAIELLALKGVRPRVAFLGDGPMREELTERCRRSGLDRVEFVGQVVDVEAWLQQASVVVRPSFSEGLPLAVLEAMSAGRLNIVSDIRPNRELIANGVNGYTFRVGSAEALAHRLMSALTDPGARLSYAARGRVDSRSRSWDRMAAETAETLVRLGAGAPR
jgi:glycosyltransferase involved in cell wall biosynthesis